jgi:hypothetical protein
MILVTTLNIASWGGQAYRGLFGVGGRQVSVIAGTLCFAPQENGGRATRSTRDPISLRGCKRAAWQLQAIGVLTL